jgi:predicted O-linked N-acetylglucosamine transferase (SPINDLY family)
MMVYSKMRICAWEGLSNDFDYIVEGFEREQKKATAFMMLAATGELSTQRVIANLFSKVLHTDAPSMSAIERYPRHDRIRVGYFSADLRNHPVAYLTAELFELHDPELFEIVVFSFGPYDAMTSRVNMAVEDYIDVRTLTNEDVVNLARSLEIDIAIDLGGYTARNRSEVFAMRVAPVQISYLGYPGTMGDGMHDYLIADRVLVPTESEHFYSEKIIRLPVYQINDSKRKISSRVFSRAELGLPATGFVYCCFNSTIKFNPQIFDVWMRILARVPGSVLFLLSSGQEANDNIRREAEARGVSKDRIVLGGKLERPEYLARYRACDLFLDTLPFNAGTTASDALWAGLPVLTCAGEAFASRMAASLLTALELPELITSTFDEYEQRAVDIADNPARLDALRGRLQQNVRSGLLFDTRLVARSIESAYMAVYERYQSGLLPESIEISS